MLKFQELYGTPSGYSTSNGPSSDLAFAIVINELCTTNTWRIKINQNVQYHTGLAMISVEFRHKKTLLAFEELEHTTSRIPKFRIPRKSWPGYDLHRGMTKGYFQRNRTRYSKILKLPLLDRMFVSSLPRFGGWQQQIPSIEPRSPAVPFFSDKFVAFPIS